MRIGKEAWMLGVLLIIFALATSYFSHRDIETGAQRKPTSFSPNPGGLKAIYQLLDRQGLKTARLQSALTELPPDAGLVVIAEPLERAVSTPESTALWKWVESGGAALILVSDSIVDLSKEFVPTDSVTPQRHISMPNDLAPEKTESAYLRDVSKIHVDGPIRLVPKHTGNEQVLVEDSIGPYAVVWKKGKGSVVFAVAGLGADNARLAAADNAIFFCNVAAKHVTAARPRVLFDEYHQGFGDQSGGKSLWSLIGAPARMTALYLLVVLAALVYNGNRRFGAAKRIITPSYRPSTEYITSMAGLYRRAGAGEIALEVLYEQFIRALALRIDAQPDANPDRIAALAAARFGWEPEALKALILQCRGAISGNKIPDFEMLGMARQIQEYRRKADIVRVS